MKKTHLIIMFATLVLLAGCKKEILITEPQTDITLHHGETYQIHAQCSNLITYEPVKEWVATVSDNGLVRANHIGGTTILLSSQDDTKSFYVTVEPRSHLYEEPKIPFGQTKAQIKSKYGDPIATQTNYYLYNYDGAYSPYLMISFKNEKVNGYVVLIENFKKRELDKFLEERYEYVVNVSSEYELYIDALQASSAKTIVGIDLFNYGGYEYWMVNYLPYTHNKGEKELIKHELEQLMK